jgi:predicted regulator of Ras-like GTPase activity (Roadblock/LC7/MglB family)
VAEGVGAHLTGISEEVHRAMRRLDMGAWKSIVFETQVAVVAMAPAPSDALLIVAASRATPLGLLRRLMGQCSERVVEWMATNGRGTANGHRQGGPQ